MTNLTATPFLMFQGAGRQALAFYTATFPGARVEDLQLYGPGEPSPEGTVRSAILIVGGQRLRIFDSPPVHAFTFTPAISFFIDCESEEQLRDLAAALGEEGGFLMPVGSYGFSQLFAWVSDRFGVSWQLNLA
jgi:predicted 3-demethylubiquinone-9 3-methyltransferase (glyoxalase superfamily)